MAGIEIHGLRKRFGDTQALDGLNLVANPGEILGIAGPNGAGKSTLIKILAGEILPDEGTMLIDGKPWSPSSAARQVAVVHQEPQLFPNLSVGENLMVGHAGTRIARPGVAAPEVSLLQQLDIDRFVNTPMDLVSLAVRQRTEIARALVRDTRCILFDEPNSALTNEESEALFQLMDSLAARGHVIILVSHRLADLVAHSVRVVVIRDGRAAAVLEGKALTRQAIAEELVVGHAHHGVSKQERLTRDTEPTEFVRLEGWTHRWKQFVDINLHVSSGEIVALVGVEGSGARELLQSLAGFQPARGRISIADRTGERAIGTYTAYVAPDRRESLFSNLSVGENIVSRLGRRQIAQFWGSLQRRKAMALARQSIQQFAIKCRSTAQPIGGLSGGNQQKVAIASAIAVRPRLLLLEEPTRGVDIASRSEIYQILRGYTREGNGVLLYATEVPEVFEVGDRVHVMTNGRLSVPLEVGQYADVGSLAREITHLEGAEGKEFPSGGVVPQQAPS